MNIKDRVILRDIAKSILITAAVAVLIIYLIVPLVFSLFRFEEITRAYFFYVAPQILAAVLIITCIVCGAQSLQYIRTYLFFGCTRKAAFLRVMLAYLGAILLGLVIIILASLPAVTALTYPVSFFFSRILGFLAGAVFFFSIGTLCASITTLSKPPLSVVLCIVAVTVLFKLEDRLSEKSGIYSYSLSFIIVNNEVITNGESPASSLIVLLLGLLALAASFVIYMLPKSSMKSTSA